MVHASNEALYSYDEYPIINHGSSTASQQQEQQVSSSQG
jgi:hypothetical protein